MTAPRGWPRRCVGWVAALVLLGLSGCSTEPGDADGGSRVGRDAGTPVAFGETHRGQFHLGPVDFAESVWTNACGPYPEEVQRAEGVLLAGVSNRVATPGSLCDACIEVTTDEGRSAVLRVITYGDTAEEGDIDVSPEAYEILDTRVFPRAMSWRLVSCDTTELMLQFQTGSSQWWTSLWVRGQSVAVQSVEVRSANHPEYTPMRLSGDGTYTDDSGFGEGAYSLRITGANGATFTYDGTGVVPGALIRTGGNL